MESWGSVGVWLDAGFLDCGAFIGCWCAGCGRIPTIGCCVSRKGSVGS